MDHQNKSLENPDQFHLDAALGWLGLGDPASAHDELEQISSAMQNHPEVLVARCEIFHATKKWDAILAIADTLLQQRPELDFIWIHRSYAMHELKRTQEALAALLPAAAKFPEHWLIRYNLGCYCSQLGRLPEAISWLKQATDLARADKEDIRPMALRDPDFAPLWQTIKDL